MKQTAVEWLIEELERIDNTFEEDSTDYADSVRYAKEIAEEMFKQQIIDAFKRGLINEMNGIEEITSEQHYKETFNK